MSSVTWIDRYAGSSVFSIFGQVEEVIAKMMLEEGKGRLIRIEEFPEESVCPDIYINELGQHAKFAIMLTKMEEAEFDNRVTALRM
jgi:hypothetical protein